MKNVALNPDNTGVLKFAPNTVFIVYTRRSNCPKKVVHTGKNLETALKIYTSFKVFKGDFKYLYWVDGTTEALIYRHTGASMRPSMQGLKIGRKNTSKRIQSDVTPSTLVDVLIRTLKTFDGMNVSKIIPYLIAHFCSLSYEERVILLANARKEVTRHVMLSGGDNTKEIKEYLINESLTEELL